MTLPQYIGNRGRKVAQAFLANTFICLGFITRSLTAGIVASTTHSIAGGTPLTTEFNVIGTCANGGDAVTLAPLQPGQSQEIYNQGAAAAAVYPALASYTIDGGAAGAAATLSAGKRARFTCQATNTITSAQLGAPSA